MKSVILCFFCSLILSAFSLTSSSEAAPSGQVSIDSLVERAKVCVKSGVNYGDFIYRGMEIKMDLFEVQVMLMTCDEAYYQYEGVCGNTEDWHIVVFSRASGKLLRGPKGCVPGK